MDRFLYLSSALAAMLALSASAAQAGLNCNGSALGGWRVATPDLAGLSTDHKRFPGDAWEIQPMDQRWPDADRNWLVPE